jgi:hypothetical protein
LPLLLSTSAEYEHALAECAGPKPPAQPARPPRPSVWQQRWEPKRQRLQGPLSAAAAAPPPQFDLDLGISIGIGH